MSNEQPMAPLKMFLFGAISRAEPVFSSIAPRSSVPFPVSSFQRSFHQRVFVPAEQRRKQRDGGSNAHHAARCQFPACFAYLVEMHVQGTAVQQLYNTWTAYSCTPTCLLLLLPVHVSFTARYAERGREQERERGRERSALTSTER